MCIPFQKYSFIRKDHRINCGLRSASIYAYANTFLPFARLAAKTFLPPFVAILARNPWTLLSTFFGCHVILLIIIFLLAFLNMPLWIHAARQIFFTSGSVNHKGQIRAVTYLFPENIYLIIFICPYAVKGRFYKKKRILYKNFEFVTLCHPHLSNYGWRKLSTKMLITCG